jgi:hypothetical protein
MFYVPAKGKPLRFAIVPSVAEKLAGSQFSVAGKIRSEKD